MEVTGDSTAGGGTAEPKPLNVYQAIAKVQGELATQGISKDRKNKEQGYQYRGIDEVYNALAPLLSRYGLCILPEVESREEKKETSSKGNALFHVIVRARFVFVSAADGSSHAVVTYGQAMDSADKATNKAMSAAYKYACLQTFCIPTAGDNDADGSTHDLRPASEFPDPAARQRFADDCLAAIGQAADAGHLRAVKTLHLAKWNAMAGSPDPADRTAWEAVKASYNAKFSALSAAPARSVTVEAAVRSVQPVAHMLGDDEITF